MLGISQKCNQPCNHKHDHQSKAEKVVKKQIKSLTKNQSEQWIAIEQQVKSKFAKLQKQLKLIQRQIFSYIQRLKEKQAQSEVKLTAQQSSKIRKVLDEKYQQVTCKDLAELVKLAKNKSNSRKPKDTKLTSAIGKNKINKAKDQKIKNQSSNTTILNETYLQIKGDIFSKIQEKLKSLINSQQIQQKHQNFNFIQGLSQDFKQEINQKYNQSFFSNNAQQKQQYRQFFNSINQSKVQETKFHQQFRKKIQQIKIEEERQSQNVYGEYIQMKKKQQGKNVKWALQSQKKQSNQKLIQNGFINMNKNQRRVHQQQQQKIRQRKVEGIEQQLQYGFQTLTKEQLQNIKQNDRNSINNQKIQLSQYQHNESIQSYDQNTFLQIKEQHKYELQKIQRNQSQILDKAQDFNMQQHYKEIEQWAIRQSIQTYQRQNQKNNVSQHLRRLQQSLKDANLRKISIYPNQRKKQQIINYFDLISRKNSVNPLIRKKYVSIQELQKQKFGLHANNNKFDILIKVIRPVQLTVVKLIDKSLLKIKFIGADQQSLAIFYANYDPRIKKGVCILLENCQLNLFKNQYEISCKSHLKGQNFLPPNTFNIQIQNLKNNFSRIRKYANGHLQYTVPSSQQIKLSQCVKNLYKNSNPISSLLLTTVNAYRINKQVIVCIISRDQAREEFIVGDYTGKVYAELPFDLNNKKGETLILVRPVIYTEQTFYGSQKIYLRPERVLSFREIRFQFDMTQIPDTFLSKNNVQ